MGTSGAHTFAKLMVGHFAGEPFVLLDVGASGGISPMWDAFKPNLRAFGFEPLLAECARLNQSSGPGIEFVPAFVAGSPVPEAQHHPMPQWWDNRFWQRTSAVEALKLLNTEMSAIFNRGDVVELSKDSVTIDEFVNSRGLDADFLKIDTDGTDFEVLRGAEKILPRLLGVMIEAEFHGSLEPRANTFANMDIYLREAGFTLADLQLHRYSRAALPRRFIQQSPSDTEFGQLRWADAIYLRDGAFPGYADLWNWRPSTAKLVKLISLYATLGLEDCAAELLLTFDGELRKHMDVNQALDALTPSDLGSENISYREHTWTPSRRAPHVSTVRSAMTICTDKLTRSAKRLRGV